MILRRKASSRFAQNHCSDRLRSVPDHSDSSGHPYQSGVSAHIVDEGFGSLDEESLEQAMKALNGLTEGNRLVGIISHVQELKARIEKQIVVTKEKAGGSRVELKID